MKRAGAVPGLGFRLRGRRNGDSIDAVHHLAYVFERFPTFTQTFCVREVMELERQGIEPLIFSVRDTRDEVPRHFPEELYQRVHFLPEEKKLIEWVKVAKERNELPQQVVLSLRHWGERPDKMRLYEAAYIGRKMMEAGVAHSHSHFAGIGARVGWWLKYCYDFTFSFTGHANDIFVSAGVDVNLDRLMADADLVVTVSDYTAGDLKRRFPGAAGRVERVYNGLEIDRFRVERRTTQPPLLFGVGRLIEKKGWDDLITACSFLKQKGRAFRCVIAGEGPLEEELRAQIAQLGVGDCVELAGATRQERIIELLGETEIFVLPCVTEKDGGKDNLPTVLMEAMAARVPCVSTRLAGVPEMVAEGETGLLVDERKPADFALAVERLLDDPALRLRMGEAGLKRAQALFAKEVTTAQLARLLVSHGLVNHDAALAAGGGLGGAYARQRLKRAARLLRFKGLRHRRQPDWLE